MREDRGETTLDGRAGRDGRRRGVRAREERRGLIAELDEQLQDAGGQALALRLVHEEVEPLPPHRDEGRRAGPEE